MTQKRRWYDKDPILSEALELLRLEEDEDTKNSAAEFMMQLKNQVAADVIEKIYEDLKKYQGKGNRWYDADPVMFKAIELLRVAPPHTQRVAALKLLLALEKKNFENINLDE